MTEKWHPGYLLEQVRGKFGDGRSRGLLGGSSKDERTLCLTRTDVFEVKRRINELDEKDKSKMRAGYYFEEALAEHEERKFKEKKRGNPAGNPKTHAR